MAPITRLIAPVALATIALGFAPIAIAQAVGPAPATTYRAEGTWAGESKCTEQAVLCEDHQIVIRVTHDADPKLYDADFTTVVDGTETPYNHLVMTFSDDHHVLVAHFTDEHKRPCVYFLAVKNDAIHGILLVDSHLVERSLDLTRTNATATPLPWDAPASASSSSSSH